MPVKMKIYNAFVECVKMILIAILIAFVINTAFIANIKVPTSSMEPAIMAGDRAVGFRLAYLFSAPKRGDVIIFDYPDDESLKYVKRIIGEPGDEVIISDGRVYINKSAQPIEEDYLNEMMETETDLSYLVPRDCYFVMGDNRNHSSDSRAWENIFVARNKIIAKVMFRYFPNIQKIE